MFEFNVLKIGYFSRNRFWGELDTIAYRDPLCTTTLIKGNGKNIIVDPSEPSELMAKTLYNRSGLKPEDIDMVFITHSHSDHYVGIQCFENAEWYMSTKELAVLTADQGERVKRIVQRIKPVGSELINGIDVVSLPGHTYGLCALLFDSLEGRTAVCGDAVMTRDFFKAQVGYYNSVDFDRSKQSIAILAGMVEVIVPGHDNYFFTKFYR